MSRGRPKNGKIIECSVCKGKKYYPLSFLKRGGGKFCSHKCSEIFSIGRIIPKTEEWKKNISINHHNVSGKNNPNWKGGKTKGRMKWTNKNWKKLLLWRTKVLKRDKNKCKLCGSTKELQVHHIIPIAETYLTAFLPMNGVTLCKECHIGTDSYGGKIKFFEKIEDGIGKTKFIIRTIPYKFQSYDTCGNYQRTEDGVTVIFVNEMKDERAEVVVILHEMIESMLTRFRGIDWMDIDMYDKWYEKNRKKNKEDEPGDNPKAPYHKEHMLATKIEKILCKELNLSWKKYNKIVYDSCK